MDAAEVIEELQRMKVTQHIARNTSGLSYTVPDELATTGGYALSRRKRKLIEQGFGWGKFVDPPSDGAWYPQGRPVVRDEDGRLQLGADADLGRIPSNDDMRASTRPGKA